MKHIYFLFFLSILTLTNCEKWDLEEESFPEVVTLEAEVDQNLLSATIRGEIKGLQNQDRVKNHGHLWTDEKDDVLELPHPHRNSFGVSGNGIFQSELSNVKPGKIYYYRAYVFIDNDVIYGEIKEFNVSSFAISIQIDSIIVIEKSSTLIEKVEISLTYSGLPIDLFVIDGGISMSKQANPNIDDHFSKSHGSFQVDSSKISLNLTPLVNIYEDHYFRPYINLNGQIFYGEDTLFKVFDIWTQKADFAGDGRSGAIGFSIGNKGYIGIGFGGGNKRYNDFWEYEQVADKWTQKADFAGGERVIAAGFSIENKGYIGTGGSGGESKKDFWEYNPSTDIWIQKADLEGGVRDRALGFSIGNKGYISIGIETINHIPNYLTDHWEYNPDTDKWTQKAEFVGVERWLAVGFSIGNKGYIGTGWDKKKRK